MRLVALFPEIARNEMSTLENGENCVLQLFAGPPHVVSLANVSANPIVVVLEMNAATRLLDRRTGRELSTASEIINIPLEAWQLLAFELRAGGPLSVTLVRIVRVLRNPQLNQLPAHE
jgi:hypothetical protein